MQILAPCRRPYRMGFASAEYRWLGWKLGVAPLVLAMLPIAFIAIAFAPLWLERDEEGWRYR